MAEISASWAATLVDPQAFREEQRRLDHVWNFLGFTGDLSRDGDWIRASIATRSVFVQRFGDELRAFENVCPHRFYPLRTEAKGNGPVICGFHHWQFNRDGKAVGIPSCKLLFGKSPAEVGACVQRVELATCGQMIFGRFATPGDGGSLADFLGDLFPVLAAMTQTTSGARQVDYTFKANWRLYLHISLDDYHSVAVHPTTFGRYGYARTLDRHRYFRCGANSVYLDSPDTDCFEKLVSGCRAGTLQSSHYFVMQVLPNLVVSHVAADRGFWYCVVMHFTPISCSRTLVRGWTYPAPFGAAIPWLGHATRAVADPFRHRIFSHFFKRVLKEDAAVCERIQEVAHQIDRSPILGAMEERVIWFERSIRELSSRRTP